MEDDGHCVNWLQMGFYEKYFHCETCGRAYKYKHTLKSHIKYECQKDPKFFCLECDYKTKIKANLTKHMRVHIKGRNMY
uniref:Longitudinals lacking protein, isoforms A/B/D/L-like n=1 Tax=Diabrotica virgifera virgifera TaxID=50390 RepID=A0A6P7FX26_DIAVI